MKKEIAANKKEAEEKEAAALKGLEEGKKKTKHCYSGKKVKVVVKVSHVLAPVRVVV